MAASAEPSADAALARALAAYPGLERPRATPVAKGLLHRTFLVRDAEAEYVLQRVNPIFSSRIHDNIRAATEHLHRKGVVTLRLLPTGRGDLVADLGGDGTWRLLTRMPGVSLDVCASPEQARAAGALVARFHSGLEDLGAPLHPLGFPYHDTTLHLRELEQALAGHSEHPLFGAVVPLAAEIRAAVEDWENLGELPARAIHGDLKFNNVLFDAGTAGDRARALSLIDLDTLGFRPLYQDLGDAWRSWCNRRGEDAAEAELDLELFRASAEGYLDALGLRMERAERASLAQGIERMSLELAARFATDALNESYFRWDTERFERAGEHNCVRARGQLSLHRQARATRGEQLRLLGAG